MTITEMTEAMQSEPRAFTTAQILAHASWNGLAGALRRGSVVRVLPGLYAAQLHAHSWEVRLGAALAWTRGAVVTGPSALRLHGMEAMPRDEVHLAIPRAEHRHVPPWLTLRRSDLAIPVTVAAHASSIAGVRVHEPAFALALGHGMVAPYARAEWVYAAVRGGTVRADDAVRAVRMLPRVVGRRALMRRLELASTGVESFLEERAWSTVLAGKLGTRLLRQHTVTARGARCRLDAYDALTRTALEFDGARWHRGDQQARDSRRDAVLATQGILTVRFTYDDVMRRAGWCRAVVEQVLAQRGEVSHHQRAA